MRVLVLGLPGLAFAQSPAGAIDTGDPASGFVSQLAFTIGVVARTSPFPRPSRS
jgi:hypothetical protein